MRNTIRRVDALGKVYPMEERITFVVLAVKGTEIFSAYVPSPKGPVFMGLIEKTFGKDLTTRTWDTLGKVVRAGGGEWSHR